MFAPCLCHAHYPAPPSVLIIVRRDGLILVHKGDVCEPSFVAAGLGGFENYPDMYALLSVDANHADEVR